MSESENFAARCHDGNFANAILLGEDAEVAGTEDLETPQAGDQREHHEQDAVLHHRELEGGELFVATGAAYLHVDSF